METIECVECGRQIPADAVMCPYCGTKTSKSIDPAETTTDAEAENAEEGATGDAAATETKDETPEVAKENEATEANEAPGEAATDSEAPGSPEAVEESKLSEAGEEGEGSPSAAGADADAGTAADAVAGAATDTTAASAAEETQSGVAPSAADKLSSKPKPNMKIIVPVAAVIVVVLAVVIFFVVQGNAEKQAYNSYIDTLEATKNEMISTGADAESICNDVQAIWQSAIFDDSRSEWDADLREYFSDDFNVAIGLYYLDDTTSSTVDSIERSQDNVAEKMAKLANPPEGLDQAYGTITELYQEYLNLTNLAISPSGNLQSFRDSFKSADEGFMASYNMLDTQIPERK